MLLYIETPTTRTCRILHIRYHGRSLFFLKGVVPLSQNKHCCSLLRMFWRCESTHYKQILIKRFSKVPCNPPRPLQWYLEYVKDNCHFYGFSSRICTVKIYTINHFIPSLLDLPYSLHLKYSVASRSLGYCVQNSGMKSKVNQTY